MITVNFLGQEITMSRYAYAYGEYLRMFDLYEKNVLQRFEVAKLNGRNAIQNALNDELNKVAHSVLRSLMSEAIYSVATSDILQGEAYGEYAALFVGSNWRSEPGTHFYKRLEELLHRVIREMRQNYLAILDENNLFNVAEIEKYSWEHSNEILSVLNESPNKKQSLIFAFIDCPYNEGVYEAAIYYNLLDAETCLTCTNFIGMEAFENVAIRSIVAQQKENRRDAIVQLTTVMGKGFVQKVNKGVEQLLRHEWEEAERIRAEQERMREEKELDEKNRRREEKKEIIQNAFGKILMFISLLFILMLLLKACNSEPAYNQRRKCGWCNGTGYNGNGARNATEYVFLKTPCTECGGDGYLDYYDYID